MEKFSKTPPLLAVLQRPHLGHRVDEPLGLLEELREASKQDFGRQLRSTRATPGLVSVQRLRHQRDGM